MIQLVKHGFLLLLAILPLTACSESYTYEGKAIKGQIVDAANQQPLQGAVVVALWAKRGGLHTDTIGYVHLDEAVTDSEGRYELKAWGPVKVSGAYMGSFSPDLLVFKQGYKYQRVNEGFLPPAKDRRVWTSKWDGKVVELEKFEGNIYEYKAHIEPLDSFLRRIRSGEQCEWKKIPEFLVAVHKAEERLKNQAARIKTRPPNAPIVTIELFQSVYQVSNQKKCGQAKDFFKGYLE